MEERRRRSLGGRQKSNGRGALRETPGARPSTPPTIRRPAASTVTLTRTRPKGNRTLGPTVTPSSGSSGASGDDAPRVFAMISAKPIPTVIRADGVVLERILDM